MQKINIVQGLTVLITPFSNDFTCLAENKLR